MSTECCTLEAREIDDEAPKQLRASGLGFRVQAWGVQGPPGGPKELRVEGAA